MADSDYNRNLIETSLDPFMAVSPDGRITDVNKATELITGLVREKLIGTMFFEYFTNTRKAEEGFLTVLREGTVRDYYLEIMHLDKRVTPVLFNASVYRDAAGNVIGVFAAARDITELKRAEERLKKELDGRNALLEFVEKAPLLSGKELYDFALDLAVHLTGSKIGFFHIISEDQKEITLTTWNSAAVKNCASVYNDHYPLEQAGNWVDCVRQKRHVIYNDFQMSPNRKGLPEGHSEVRRFMSIPVFEGDKVHLIFGVGNKIEEYGESDAIQIQLVAKELQKILNQRRADQALQESEEKYRSRYEESFDGLYVTSPEGRILDMNKKGIAMFGYETKEEILSLDLQKDVYAYPPDRNRILAMVNARGTAEYDVVVKKKNGEKMTTHCSLTAVRNSMGEITSYRGIIRDVTEIRHAEETLKRSEKEKAILNRIASIFLTIPDEAMYGEVLAVILEAMASKYGIFGFIGDKGDLVIPSLTKNVWNECQVPEKNVVFPTETWGNSIWGHAIREKRTFVSSGPFSIPAGHIQIDQFLTTPIIFGQNVIGLLSVANKGERYVNDEVGLLEQIAAYIAPILNARLQRDAQEKKRKGAEVALSESEDKYRLLIAKAGEAIFILQDETIKFPNPMTLEMMGYSEEELLETFFIDIIHSEDRSKVLEKHLTLTKREDVYFPYLFRIVRKDGGVMWAELNTTPITWENRPGVLCFLRDVTEEKRLESQFIQAQKMEAVGQLAGGIAHDLNNLLTPIIGYVEIALLHLSQEDPLFCDMEQVLAAGSRAKDLTKQLLAFSRKQTLDLKVLKLDDVIADISKMLRRLIKENIDIKYKRDPLLKCVRADVSQMQQVIINLVVNANDAMPDGGTLVIETANVTLTSEHCETHAGISPGTYAMLSVTDTGHGMDDKTLRQIFEPFFTTKVAGKGTGLGLATVYGIVKQHGGNICAFSEPGRGSTFKMYLPAVDEAPDMAGRKREISFLKGSETVLIVEDEDIVRNLAKRILEANGYKVILMESPADAILFVERNQVRIDILLTDVIMPQINGRELYDKINILRPGIKVLFMSGYPADIIAHHSFLDEGVHFMQKPFSIELLTLKIREVLDA